MVRLRHGVELGKTGAIGGVSGGNGGGRVRKRFRRQRFSGGCADRLRPGIGHRRGSGVVLEGTIGPQEGPLGTDRTARP